MTRQQMADRCDQNRNRSPFNRRAVYRLLEELADSAGLVGEGDDQVDGVHPHRLRHTFVTTLLGIGVPAPSRTGRSPTRKHGPHARPLPLSSLHA